jgi:hypothetical protein
MSMALHVNAALASWLAHCLRLHLRLPAEAALWAESTPCAALAEAACICATCACAPA